LAEEATKTYLAHPECFDEEAAKILSTQATGRGFKIRFTHSVEESIALNKIKSNAIIIAGGGMCEGGRIRHHFKHNLWRPECSVVFVGFQATGTLGRRIVDGAHVVHMLGDEIAVRSRVYTIGGFSAHADRKGLLEWLTAFKNKPEVFVVHGEAEVSLGFAKTINEQFGLTTHIPHKGEVFEL
jgi:metallo-beta-lactamase family protein